MSACLLPALWLLVAAPTADPPAVPDKPFVVLPDLQPVAPPSPPTPMPAPDQVTRLSRDVAYVFGADRPPVVITSPPGRLRVTVTEGPLRVREVWADQPDRGKQSRDFKFKYVYELTIPDGATSGDAELLILPPGAADAGELVRRAFYVNSGKAPQPPPTPTPAPAPTPTPAPTDSPFPTGEGLRALIVYDATVAGRLKMPTSQQLILGGERSRGLLSQLCRVGPDGATRDWRMWPDGTDGSADAAPFDAAMKRKRPELPWLYLGGGKGTPFDGKLPADPDAFEAAVKAAAGN